MTRDEIFSNELEYLYFRLVAARNALNETKDPDTERCLYDILTDTLDKIDRKGSEEDRAAASEIVVRKSNKYARYILTNQKVVLLSTIGAVLIGAGALLAIIMIIIGSESKLKPSLIIGGIAALTIAALVVIIKIKKGRMDIAREHLKGKTVIGAKINTYTSKDSDEIDFERGEKSKGESLKVAHNFKGVFVTSIVVILVLLGAFVIKNKGSDIVRSAKIIMVNIGLNPNKPDYSYEDYVELNDMLQKTHDRVCYDAAMDYAGKKNYADAYAMMKEIPLKSSYLDSEQKLKELNAYMKFDEAMGIAEKSLYEAASILADIPSDMDEISELVREYRSYISLRGTYSDSGNTFVIRDFVVKDGKVYLVEDARGNLEIVKNDRPGALCKAVEKIGNSQVSWFVFSDRVTRQQEASSVDYIKK